MTDRLHETLTWQVGDVTITRLVEVILRAPVNSLFPNRSARELEAHAGWLKPNFIDADDRLLISIHAFLIKAGNLRIIVDTCAGNGKNLPLFDEWKNLQTPFLANLAEVGFAPETIDRVLCTHLHFDHVGWNTRLDNGNWVPTFPNARYLFGAAEWDHWKDAPDPYGSNALDQALKPVFAAGLVDLVETDHRICDEIRLIPTPGHTPGHVSVLINSRGAEAVITGDMFHHPLQMANPEWIDMGDHQAELAERTRIAFMERFGNRPSLVLGTHFATPTAGKIVGARGGFRFIA